MRTHSRLLGSWASLETAMYRPFAEKPLSAQSSMEAAQQTWAAARLAASFRRCSRSSRMLEREYSAATTSCSEGIILSVTWLATCVTRRCTLYTGFLDGMKAHELLTAPNPARSPRMMVPRTTSRDRVAVIRSVSESATGRGIQESAKR